MLTRSFGIGKVWSYRFAVVLVENTDVRVEFEKPEEPVDSFLCVWARRVHHAAKTIAGVTYCWVGSVRSIAY